MYLPVNIWCRCKDNRQIDYLIKNLINWNYIKTNIYLYYICIMINVNRKIEDTFYRYKMPSVETKVEGRGNGIKTAIPNITAVAKALDRPPFWLLKYLAIELGTGCKLHDGQQGQHANDEDKRYIINGKFDTTRLQELLDGFIKDFVLCAKCGNPETKLRVTSKKLIESKCIACGYKCFTKMIHKLTTYIVNNPSTNNVADNKKDKLTKAERRALKTVGQDGGESGKDKGQSSLLSNVDQRLYGGTIDAPVPVESGDEEEEWSTDVSDEAVRFRTGQLGTGVTHLTMTNDLDKSMGERLEIFNTFVIEKKKEKRFPSKEIIGEAGRLECSDKGVMVLVQQLWSNADDVVSAMAKYQGLFQRFTMDKPKAQMYTLQATEKLIELDPTKLDKIPYYLKQMYDLDIVDEEIFFEWAKKPSKNIPKELAVSIRETSKGFLDWLKNAEIEESSDDENVAFETVTPSIVQPLVEDEEHDSDEFDIDDL